MFQFTGFTEKANAALNRAFTAAEDAGHTYVGTEHLLYALASDAEGVAGSVLTGAGVGAGEILERLRAAVGEGVPTVLTQEDVTPRLRRVIAEALRLSRDREFGAGTGHLLLALTNEKNAAAALILSALGVSPAALRNKLSAGLRGAEHLLSGTSAAAGNKKGLPTLEKYAVEMTAHVRAGRFDPVVCREKEIDRVIRILCRRTKNNPCLIGEPGVGKTAVVEGLAARIAEGNVPEALRGKQLWSLELNSMVAGAKYRGDFEERMKNLLREVSASGQVILFLDELHNLIGAGSAEGAVDAANILKPSLSRGELRLIGATTVEEYRRTVEKDAALERRFQKVTVEEPSPARAREILEALRPGYEAFHGCRITDEAIFTAVKLSVRYLNDRFLPDKALDLIDEAAAKKTLERQKNAPAPKASALRTEEARDALRQAKTAGDEAQIRLAASALEEARRAEGPSPAPDLPVPIQALGADEIAAVLSEQTGIPAESLQSDEKLRLKGLEAALSACVIGQRQAVKAVAAAIRRSRTGLGDPNRPMGVFFFCGPTGVGKTELAKAIAKCVFQDEKALIRVDMSEFSEQHSVARLFGSPPGYVGYEEGGQLTEKLRRRPYSVVLFDETEKAHPDVFNALLQILEEGTLTSSDGKRVNCRNCIIILTSNAGDRFVTEALPRLGFAQGAGEADTESAVKEALKAVFRPEFLNRMDEIVVFRSLTEVDLTAIAQKMLRQLAERAADAGVSLRYGGDVALFLAKTCLTGHYGARPLRRKITSEIEDPLSELLLSDALPDGKAQVSVKDGRIDVERSTIND